MSSSSNDVFIPSNQFHDFPLSPTNSFLDSRGRTGYAKEIVRLDRRKIERLQNGNGEYLGEGQFHHDIGRFLDQIQRDTRTSIGMRDTYNYTEFGDSIRSRKDPAVVITGDAKDVQDAKERINVLFNSRRDRVTLKLDISFDAHSHIIGRGGRSIQHVMDATSTHVHFPDSNRTSTFEKSNQVSIAGTAVGAEKARCQVRDLMPITINYEIPLTAFNRRFMDTTGPLYQMLQREYAISVAVQPVRVFGDFFDFGEPSIIKLSIRGIKGTADLMRSGAAILLEQVTSGTYNLSSTPATCDIEIAVQNHLTVIGRNEGNVQKIMQTTDAIITFPEHSSVPFIGPAASSLPNRKSTVNVKGPNFDSVFKAWDDLQGYLPLILIFDLNEGQEIDATYVARLMERYKVSIQVKPKIRQNISSVIVKGTEKDSRVLFEVRRELLNLERSDVPYCCTNHFFKTYSVGSEPSLIDPLPSPLAPNIAPRDIFRSQTSSLLDCDGIWGPPGFKTRPPSVDSYPTPNWLPHNCFPSNSRQSHDTFLSSDRFPISRRDPVSTHNSVTTLLKNAGLDLYAQKFEDISLEQFTELTRENLTEFPFTVIEKLLTLASELKWRLGSQRDVIDFN